jgi:hypothetical protein
MSENESKRLATGAWLRKVAMIVLSPIVILLSPLGLLVIACLGLYAVASNYLLERGIHSRMKRCGRYLPLSQLRPRISEREGTLIIERPSLGWNFTHAWWTPDNVLAKSPFLQPTDEDYRNAAKKRQCLDWDKWCWSNYTSLDDGHAFLLRVWNGASVERQLKQWFPDLNVVHTWTFFVHFEAPPAASPTSAD